MKIFFDTEFTGLHKNTTLISIGMVDENNNAFYAEFTDFDEKQCDDWIKENVIAHLKYHGTHTNMKLWGRDPKENLTYAIGDTEFIREKIEQWLLPHDKVQLVSDVCHYDMVLFIDIWGGAFDIPRAINPSCHDLNQDIAEYYCLSEDRAFDLSREELANLDNYPIEGDKHNSLFDAKVIKQIYEFIHE